MRRETQNIIDSILEGTRPKSKDSRRLKSLEAKEENREHAYADWTKIVGAARDYVQDHVQEDEACIRRTLAAASTVRAESLSGVEHTSALMPAPVWMGAVATVAVVALVGFGMLSDNAKVHTQSGWSATIAEAPSLQSDGSGPLRTEQNNSGISVAEIIAAAPAGAVLELPSLSSSETLVISKRITLKAYGGLVRLGDRL